MFERYTERARRVIFFARQEANRFGSKAIETEHFLLGLLREDGHLTLLSSASRIDDRGGRDFLDRSRAATDHGQSQFFVENLEDAIHSLLAKG